MALYDERLEVTSPGGLYNGLTFGLALQGHSRLRNRAIANVFNQMGLIEAWGTGLQRIRNAAQEYGLPEPVFIDAQEYFRVNLYRRGIEKDTETNTKTGTNTNTKTDTNAMTDTERKILTLIRQNPESTLEDMMNSTGLSKSGVRYALNRMREREVVAREGTRKNGKWIIKE